LRTSAALALTILALAGCGGDDEPPEPAITTPDLTVPGADSAPESTPTATETAPAPAPPPADTSGGATVPQGEQPESPEGDTPPGSGSPEERFENFCDANPGACG
jgi:hypothetical protein